MAWSRTSGLCSPIQVIDYTAAVVATAEQSTDASAPVIEKAPPVEPAPE